MPQISFRAMGCKITAVLYSKSSRAAAQLQNVPLWFESWESVLSRFREDSELNQVNRSSGVPVHVSGVFLAVLSVAERANHGSGGLVTPGILNTLESIGYDRSFDRMPESVSGISIPLKPDGNSPGYKILANNRIVLNAGTRLDFGGVAKGWAAFQAMKKLSLYGPSMVNAGGDISISGLRPGYRKWVIRIVDPAKPENHIETISVGRAGVATSGRDYRHWEVDGQVQHHIIDPRTNTAAVTDLISATVIAPTVLQAEMASKSLMILGGHAGLQWVRRHPSFAAFVVFDSGNTDSTENFDVYK
jgi:thiamine biosynthesis lipoprotein